MYHTICVNVKLHSELRLDKFAFLFQLFCLNFCVCGTVGTSLSFSFTQKTPYLHISLYIPVPFMLHIS